MDDRGLAPAGPADAGDLLAPWWGEARMIAAAGEIERRLGPGGVPGTVGEGSGAS